MTENKQPSGNYILPITIVLVGIAVLTLDSLEWFSPQNRLAKGKKAMESSDYVRAIRQFSKAQSHCETDIEARFLLGAAYERYGWNDEALVQYESTWRLAMIDGGRARHNSGRIWMQKGDPAKAVNCYREALTLLPFDDEIWFDLGVALQPLNRMPSALAAFQEAVRLNPRNKYYLNALRELQQRLGNSVIQSRPDAGGAPVQRPGNGGPQDSK